MALGKRLQTVEGGSLSLLSGLKMLPRLRAKAPADPQQAAFETLIDGCWDALWRYAYRISGNRDDAEDLLSEALMEGFRSFKQFRGDTPFVRWMYRVVTTTHIDMVRRAARRRAVSLEAGLESGGIRDLPDESPAADPQHATLDPMLSEPVEAALAALPADFRSIVVLADVQEMDYADISRTLDIPIGTVRSRLHRARGLLRKMLAHRVEEEW